MDVLLQKGDGSSLPAKRGETRFELLQSHGPAYVIDRIVVIS